MRDEALLGILARRSALAIVERYASDVHDRKGLMEAIERLVRLGLEGSVRLWAQETGAGEQRPPMG
jgi:hypothetical protein